MCKYSVLSALFLITIVFNDICLLSLTGSVFQREKFRLALGGLSQRPYLNKNSNQIWYLRKDLIWFDLFQSNSDFLYQYSCNFLRACWIFQQFWRIDTVDYKCWRLHFQLLEESKNWLFHLHAGRFNRPVLCRQAIF
jgi:hypothetical protein